MFRYLLWGQCNLPGVPSTKNRTLYFCNLLAGLFCNRLIYYEFERNQKVKAAKAALSKEKEFNFQVALEARACDLAEFNYYAGRK